ncbi:Retrovirus-related Pol polyprotein from transposon TNT 1-94-like protein [Drosera capensis]
MVSKGYKPIEVKWEYRKKTNPEGKMKKYKARLVAKGYVQQEEEELYIQQPSGYQKRGQEDKVYRLKKALYELKAWNTQIDSYFEKNGFQKSPRDHSLYTKMSRGDVMVIYIYVDDMIFTGNNPKMFEVFKKSMMKEFVLSSLDNLSTPSRTSLIPS